MLGFFTLPNTWHNALTHISLIDRRQTAFLSRWLLWPPKVSVHASIFFSVYPIQGHVVLEPIPAVLVWQGTPWRSCQSVAELTQGLRQPLALIFTPVANIELPLNLTPWICLDCKKMPERESMQTCGEVSSNTPNRCVFKVAFNNPGCVYSHISRAGALLKISWWCRKLMSSLGSFGKRNSSLFRQPGI